MPRSKNSSTRRRARKRRTEASRTCQGKTRYNSEVVAMREGVRFDKRHYRCPNCGGWHLTSRLLG